MDELNTEKRKDDLTNANDKDEYSQQENLNSTKSKKNKKDDRNKTANKELMDKILSVTLIITEKFPELSKFLSETPRLEVDYENPEISSNHLRDYYESLNSILNKYKLEHPED